MALGQYNEHLENNPQGDRNLSCRDGRKIHSAGISRLLSLVVLLAAGCIFMVSCATDKGSLPKTDRYMVTAERTPFYRYGPAQGSGADSMLLKGQPITMIKRSFGFSQVMTSTGISGYVATDDVGPAPAPSPTPQPKPVPAPDYSDYLPSQPRQPGESVPPRDLEPPMGLPTSEPVPGFRY